MPFTVGCFASRAVGVESRQATLSAVGAALIGVLSETHAGLRQGLGALVGGFAVLVLMPLRVLATGGP